MRSLLSRFRKKEAQIPEEKPLEFQDIDSFTHTFIIPGYIERMPLPFDLEFSGRDNLYSTPLKEQFKLQVCCDMLILEAEKNQDDNDWNLKLWYLAEMQYKDKEAARGFGGTLIADEIEKYTGIFADKTDMQPALIKTRNSAKADQPGLIQQNISIEQVFDTFDQVRTVVSRDLKGADTANTELDPEHTPNFYDVKNLYRTAVNQLKQKELETRETRKAIGVDTAP